MINRLIEFSLKNRPLILIAYLILGAWGYWALLKTPIDAIPDLSENQVIVYTDWSGRSPQEVEESGGTVAGMAQGVQPRPGVAGRREAGRDRLPDGPGFRSGAHLRVR